MDSRFKKIMFLIARLTKEGHDRAYIDRVVEDIIRKDCEKRGVNLDDVIALSKNPSLADDPAFLEKVKQSHGHKNQTRLN